MSGVFKVPTAGIVREAHCGDSYLHNGGIITIMNQGQADELNHAFYMAIAKVERENACEADKYKKAASILNGS